MYVSFLGSLASDALVFHLGIIYVHADVQMPSAPTSKLAEELLLIKPSQAVQPSCWFSYSPSKWYKWLSCTTCCTCISS